MSNQVDLWIFKVWFFSSEGPGPGAIDQTDDPQLAYIHFEHRGAPIAVSNEEGEMIWQAHYQPFGEIEELTDVDGDGEVYTFNLRYPGQYHDQESGYYYNYFRTYDPKTGRYLESDPIGLAGDINTYTYVGGDPLIYIDLYGLDTLNLFPPNDRIQIYTSDIQAAEGEYMVKGHGDEYGVWDDRQSGRSAETGPQLAAQELANLIRENGWEPGEPIFLYSCNTGDGNYHQQLADEMGAVVTAPNGYMYSPGFGKYRPSHVPFFPIFSYGADYVIAHPR
ncbi:MAG: RHS repeat-associated core domain-containing protein [Candidatus Thiodiazotropha sp.]